MLTKDVLARTVRRTDGFGTEPPMWRQRATRTVQSEQQKLLRTNGPAASLPLYSAAIPGLCRAISPGPVTALWGAPERTAQSIADLSGGAHPGIAQDIARLVLDGILEIEADGGFVSGPPAWPVLFGDHPLVLPDGVIGELSVAALRLASDLDAGSVDAVAARLYGFNFAPATASWRRRLPSAAAVDRFLDTDAVCRMPALAQAWKREPARLGFIYWSARSAPRGTDCAEPRYKLYVSPGIESLPDCLARAAAVIADHAAPAFKVGADLCGLLRPDKMVIYETSLVRLAALAKDLATEVGAMRPCGVPFTAAIGDTGLLSWAIDPDAERAGGPNISWRVWISRMLAAALLTARQHVEATDMAPFAFALRRIALEGVDPATWRPTRGFCPDAVPAGS